MTDQEVLPTAALDHTVDTLLDTLLAVLDRDEIEPIEDAITAWHDRGVNAGRDEQRMELAADVATEAIRQAFERQTGRCSIRVTFQSGGRLTFSWLPGNGPQEGNFADVVKRAVTTALRGNDR